MSVPENRLNYRADIDGLRGIAVGTVVGFHLFPEWVRGGFVGVDVFFVISGFLITSIIVGALDRGKFSFAGFYARRVRRIFPALFLVLVASCALGWFILLADEFQQLGKHIAAAAAFLSNFALWKEFGYFDNSSDTKPLLHLWSLGIEEQFYLVWPFLTWAVWKLERRRGPGSRLTLLNAVILVGVVSFAINLVFIHRQPIAAYYAPQARFWELLIGAALACVAVRGAPVLSKPGLPKGSAVSAVGGVLLLAGLCLINRNSGFPGWWALLPTLGTAAIITAGPQAWLNRTLLSNRFLVWVGLISFPLYLWHWPLISFARILEHGLPSIGTRFAIIAISFALAALTYRIVELPIRVSRITRPQIAFLVTLLLVTGLAGFQVYRKGGYGNRMVAKLGGSIMNSGYVGGDLGLSVHECGIAREEDKKVFSNCFQDSRGQPRFAVIGDSRANFLYNGLLRTSSERGRWLLIGGVNGTGGALIPVLTSAEVYQPYQKTLQAAIDAIVRNRSIEVVVIAAAVRNLFHLDDEYSVRKLPTSPNYPVVKAGLREVILKFTGVGKRVLIPVENPIMNDPKECIVRRTGLKFLDQLVTKSLVPGCYLDLKQNLELTSRYRRLLTELAEEFPGKVTIFDTTDAMCDAEQGLCLHVKKDHLMYSFSDHISDYAAGIIGEDINKLLNQSL